MRHHNMQTKHYILPLLVLGYLLSACQESNTFSQSPTERTHSAIEALRTELTANEAGWLMVYFPKTDSLLYTNPSVHIRDKDYGSHLAGYGGFCYGIKFLPDGTLTMLGDKTEEQTDKEQSSAYLLRPGSTTTLSFTSYNYIHELVDANFEGRTDFVYMGKDKEGNLRFKTNAYIESAQEYVWLKPLTAEQDYRAAVKQAYEHRKRFDAMNNPQIVIRSGDKIYFRSDRSLSADRSELRKYQDKRYRLFLYAAQPSSYPGAYPLKMNGLGSGYAGTDRGLSFLSGIRLSKDFSFYHFEWQEDRFVSRLVKAFDPIERKFKYVSHLEAPNGEDTGVIAEVYDATP